jgi:hypothetical protein
VNNKPGYFVCALIVKGKSVEIRRQGSLAQPNMALYMGGVLIGAGYRSKAECLKEVDKRLGM